VDDSKRGRDVMVKEWIQTKYYIELRKYNDQDSDAG
jgi:hypothetical protein